MSIDTASLQRFMQAKGFYHGKIDRDYGPASKAAARAVLAAAQVRNTQGWPDDRVRVAIEQLLMNSVGINVGEADGVAGARTQVGYEKWQDKLTFEGHPLRTPTSPPPTSPVVWPKQNYAALVEFYGEPGTNQTLVTSPYGLVLDWDTATNVSRFSCHKLVASSAQAAMEDILEIYGIDEIKRLGLNQFGGCLNVRKMRNGSSWSTHAWGIAIDWDADRNTLRETSRTARMAQPEYKPFLDVWEKYGWVSLGRARNFDWMHVQAARL